MVIVENCLNNSMRNVPVMKLMRGVCGNSGVIVENCLSNSMRNVPVMKLIRGVCGNSGELPKQ